MLRTRARNAILAEVVGLTWKLISDDGVSQLPNMQLPIFVSMAISSDFFRHDAITT